ncbi:MAG: CRISPR-associated endonuclease Cas3'', partial [Oscillospiraceae bacterium]
MGNTAFLAHINEENEKQTLKVHLQTTSMLCGQFADKINCKNIGLLCGLLHDIGKYTSRFNTYLLNAHNGIFGQKHNHSSAGGVLLFSLMEKETDGFSLLLKQIVSEAICCHHSGLCDNLTPNGEDGFLKRVSEKQDILYDEVYQNFCDEFSIEKDVLPLISLAKNELIAIVKKINLAEIDTVFSFGLLQKYLFSCLTDADRLDTACFMLGEKLPITNNNQVLFEKLAENLENQLNILQSKPKGTESVDKLNA